MISLTFDTESVHLSSSITSIGCVKHDSTSTTDVEYVMLCHSVIDRMQDNTPLTFLKTAPTGLFQWSASRTLRSDGCEASEA